MQDLRSILSSHHNKSKVTALKDPVEGAQASTSQIPDLFFDEILVHNKLGRVDVLTLMFLYRITWCRPNLHRKFGIAPMISHKELAQLLEVELEQLFQSLRGLESWGFIETIRSGQYFVRKYFTAEFDKKYGQTYDNFL